MKEVLQKRIELTERKLSDYLSARYPDGIYEAMRYSALAGGKRLRPVLLLSVCEELGGKAEAALPFACALEMIHTYSLIHDDLPAMDNDDFRRGKPTNHKMFGEANAILAGDGLLHYAFEIMFASCVEHPEYIKAGHVISRFSGMDGMLVGQYVDVNSEGKPIDKDTLIYIHENKTAGLIKAALCAGAYVAGADEDVVSVLESIGSKLGIAFQIMDDILDVTSTSEKLGKPVLSDIKNEKNTYVSLFGLDKAKEDYERLNGEIYKELDGIDFKSDFMKKYIAYISKREN